MESCVLFSGSLLSAFSSAIRLSAGYYSALSFSIWLWLPKPPEPSVELLRPRKTAPSLRSPEIGGIIFYTPSFGVIVPVGMISSPLMVAGYWLFIVSSAFEVKPKLDFASSSIRLF